MKKRIAFMVLLFSITTFALNQLSIQDHDYAINRDGYIDKATLVVEPHGCYAEQSLYLQYSDHEQFAPEKQLEIVHRFNLPEGSVINDMWLWIGDSVMQAKMYDTWTAQDIYDSIVNVKRDPAFLTKSGDQYSLKVYPLFTGEFRKVKLNFVSPILWLGNKPVVEMPVDMLKADNADNLPLKVLFRTRTSNWGIPEIQELPSSEFSFIEDTLNYSYSEAKIVDIKNEDYLSLTYDYNFSDNFICNAARGQEDTTFYQIGIEPYQFFDIAPDSSAKKVFIGLDLSGNTDKELDVLLPEMKNLMASSLKANDQFKLAVSDGNQTEIFTNEWLFSTSLNIDEAVDNFGSSEFADSISVNTKPSLLFVDYSASNCWAVDGVDSIAFVEVGESFLESKNKIAQADIVASYEHGHERVLDQDEADLIIESLDSLFLNGGRFLTYFDYNRENNKEKLAIHYIDGLSVLAREGSAVTLYRNEAGNIGTGFPEQITRNSAYYLQYNDPDVVVELVDAQGRPTVISKRIGNNGLIVVSGMWQFYDDAALKTILSTPLLGLNSNSNTSNKSNVKALLTDIKEFSSEDNIDKILLVSNSDSLYSSEHSQEYAANYFEGYTEPVPTFNTINLLEGKFIKPPYIVEDFKEYYGSGILLKTLAENSGGIHFEKHEDEWFVINSSLNPYFHGLESVELNIESDNGIGNNIATYEVLPGSNKFMKPMFYIGSVKGSEILDFNFKAKLVDSDTEIEKSVEYFITNDSLVQLNILSSMVGYEELKDLYQNYSSDTLAIVNKAIQHNLLCDYTALLALEPDENNHFMIDPFDESQLAIVEMDSLEIKDSINVKIFPNPFNNTTKISFKVKNMSDVQVAIYNIKGQQVHNFGLMKDILGERTISWEANNYSSGLYFVRTLVLAHDSKKKKSIIKNIMLIK